MQEVDNYQVYLQEKLDKYRNRSTGESWRDYQEETLKYLDKVGKEFIDQFEQRLKALVMQKVEAIQGAVGVYIYI